VHLQTKWGRSQILTKKGAGVIAVFILISVIAFAPIHSRAATPIQGACNCVIFRVDDVQDYWLNKVQAALMDHFIFKKEKLSVGIIMHYAGNDSSIVNKIRTGHDAGVLELAIHGWNHVDYTTLTAQQQRDTLKQANQKMASLWGDGTAVFIPPFNTYNDNTLSALQSLKMKVISIAFDQELPTIYNSAQPSSLGNKVYKAIPGSDIKDKYGIYHVPEAVSYYNFHADTSSKTPVKTILNSIDGKIASYGYAVVTLHPQDFAVKDASNKPTNQVDPHEMSDLDTIINHVDKQGYAITDFSGVMAHNAVSK